jgi:hypothetical protein
MCASYGAKVWFEQRFGRGERVSCAGPAQRLLANQESADVL